MRYLFYIAILALTATALKAQSNNKEVSPPQPQGQQGWVQIAAPTTVGQLFVTRTGSDTVWAGADVIRSTDRGLSWGRSATPFGLAAISFYNSRMGCAIPGPMAYVTKDGGVTWDSALTGMNDIHAVQVVIPDTIFACFLGYISRSTNSGKSWTVTELRISSMTGFSFADSRHGFVVGDMQTVDPNKPDAPPFYLTTNAGESWVSMYTGFNHSLTGVAAIDDTTVFVVGAGYIAKTTNAGLTWNETRLTSPLNGFEAISFHGRTEGVAVGANGTIYFTSDGGNNWILEPTPTTQTLYGAAFIDDTTIIVVGDHGTVLRTTNLGVDGVTQPPPQQPLSVQTLPNPTRGNTQFVFNLPTPQHVTLTIYTVAGALVHQLMTDAFQPSGLQSVSFDCSALPSGTYMYQLTSESYQASGTLQVIK